MDKNTRNRFFAVVSLLLSLAGMVFLCISMFGNDKSTTPLAIALGCIVLSNIINIIRLTYNKKE